MSGIWITRLARRVTHENTFETMVSPALADLEMEASRGWRQRARHYAGLIIVFGCALLRDIRVDAGLVSFASAWETWRKAVFWQCANVIPVTVTFLWVNPWPYFRGVELIVVATFAIGFLTAPVSTMAAAFYLRRGGLSDSRAIVAAIVVPLVLLAPMRIAANVLRPFAASVVYEAAAPRIEADKSAPGLLTASLEGWETYSRQPLTVWSVLGSTVTLPLSLSAPIGVWLARRRGWRIVRSLLGLYCALGVFTVAGALATAPGFLVNDARAVIFSLLGPALVWLLVLFGSPRPATGATAGATAH